MMRKLALTVALSLCLASPAVEAATLIVEPPSAPATELPPRAVPEDPIVEIILPDGSVAKNDVSGKGAVLCAWMIYVGVQYTTRKCGWAHLPTDDAINQAVDDIDQFIIDNMPSPMTQAQLDELKSKDNDWLWDGSAESIAKMCSVEDDNAGGPAAFAWSLRSRINAESLRSSVVQLMSVPREPVMNPCL
jgi:hypothetical protein